MFIDSHCHLSFPQLASDIEGVLGRMRTAGVEGALNVCVTLEEFPAVVGLAEARPNIWASVGVHPDYRDGQEPDVATLVRLSRQPRVVAIGETGLDYFRLKEPLDWQRERFRVHIRAAREAGLPLVIHTRAAAADTLQIMREERAGEVGGVMHCFTETMEFARQALDLGFLISFSGIVTFKNAGDLREIAAAIPAERLLIETDAPYLAPVPHRGRANEPGFVPFVADVIAELKGVDRLRIGEWTSSNFHRLFNV
ncbi:MAG: TatD family hydrolase [Gemmatimonadota bacterium]